MKPDWAERLQRTFKRRYQEGWTAGWAAGMKTGQDFERRRVVALIRNVHGTEWIIELIEKGDL